MRRLGFLFALAVAGCTVPPLPLPVMADVDRARGATMQERAFAPQAFDEADAEGERARETHAAGDDAAAALHAERAIAAYQRARMVARSARATADLARAEGELASKTAELRSLENARKAAERDGEELAKRLAIAREMHAPAPAGPADAKREVARRQASRTLATQARLLCGAAKLLGAQARDLDEANRRIDALDKRLEQTRRPAPIDEAASVRTACLSVLTRTRHAARASASAATTATDVLLSELSAAGMSPSRDERGVVVTLRGAFAGARALTPAAQTRLEALGRVAAAHADLAVQVVVHDASPQPHGDDRAKAAAAALVKGGAKPDRVATFMAGTRVPVVDPADARNRARNARLEIVFVTGN
jgi:flagellar motor protein MotB